jgi:hypothetical protein
VTTDETLPRHAIIEPVHAYLENSALAHLPQLVCFRLRLFSYRVAPISVTAVATAAMAAP